MATRKVLCFISLPNSLAYQFEVHPDDKGGVCLDKVSMLDNYCARYKFLKLLNEQVGMHKL